MVSRKFLSGSKGVLELVSPWGQEPLYSSRRMPPSVVEGLPFQRKNHRKHEHDSGHSSATTRDGIKLHQISPSSQYPANGFEPAQVAPK